jgi:hypothetical protein
MTIETCVLGGNDKMLLPNSTSQTIILENNTSGNAARKAVKNIVYAVVDTYMTAKDFALNGEVNDPYAVQIDKISVTEAAYSPWFTAIWVVLDVLFAGEFAFCIFCIVKPFIKKKGA